MERIMIPIAKASPYQGVSFAYFGGCHDKAPAGRPVCASMDRDTAMVWQYLSLADLTALRDWCDRVLTIAKA